MTRRFFLRLLHALGLVPTATILAREEPPPPKPRDLPEYEPLYGSSDQRLFPDLYNQNMDMLIARIKQLEDRLGAA